MTVRERKRRFWVVILLAALSLSSAIVCSTIWSVSALSLALAWLIAGLAAVSVPLSYRDILRDEKRFGLDYVRPTKGYWLAMGMMMVLASGLTATLIWAGAKGLI